jgi:hypothetical protein
MKYIASIFYSVKRTIGSSIFWFLNAKDFYKYLVNLKRSDFLKNVNYDPAPIKIAIIIHAWFLGPAPFFSIVTGLFLSKKNITIDFIVDDLKFGDSTLLFYVQIKTIKFLTRIIPSNYKVIYISQLIPVDENIILDDDDLKDLAKQNTIHYMKGELKMDGRKDYYDIVYNDLYKARPYIYSLFENSTYNSFYLAGGVCGTTSIYIKYGEHFKLNVATFDSGAGVLVTSVNGVATHLTDIPLALKLLKSDPDFEMKKVLIKQYVNNQILARRSGTDAFDSQIINNNSSVVEFINVGVLILLNSSWDSAALGINNIFNSYIDWLIETVYFLINHTDQIITIRQHPAERFDLAKGNDDFKIIIRNKFGETSRINFIDCYSEINTYNLIERSNIIICFSSTSGIESAIFGKKVIVTSNCYYSNEDFVYKPGSINDYYSIILSSLGEKFIITPTQIENAILCYYLGQCCNWIFTDFTPMYSDFKKWVKVPASQIYNFETIDSYLKSIERGIPSSYLISTKKLNIDFADCKI